MNIYVLRDSKAKTCGKNLMLFKNTGEAIRALEMTMEKDKEGIYAKYPEDFALFTLGNYNEEDGAINLLAQKEHVIDLVELVRD